MLELLAGGDLSVGRITDALGMEISHVSHQLAVLRRAGLVDGRREGSVVFYSLRQPELSLMLNTVAGELLWESAASS